MGMSKRDRPLLPIPGPCRRPEPHAAAAIFMPRCAARLARTLRCRDRSARRDRLRPITRAACAGRRPSRCRRPELAVAADQCRPTTAIIEARSLSRTLSRSAAASCEANDGLDLDARRGEVLGIVGESGSGKSTFARVLAGLEAAAGGDASLRRRGYWRAAPCSSARPSRWQPIQMVFQNPDGTLNPSLSGRLADRPRAAQVRRSAAAAPRSRSACVGCSRWCSCRRRRGIRLPRQLSGGQKQRIAIARAFAGSPELLIADEPTSALDVSVQATVVNLLLSIQAESGTTMVFISHDLSLVRYIADHVVVMYLGRVDGGRPDRGALFPAVPSLYRGAALRRADTGPASRAASASASPAKYRAPPTRRPAAASPAAARASSGAICDQEHAAGARCRRRASHLLPHPVAATCRCTADPEDRRMIEANGIGTVFDIA